MALRSIYPVPAELGARLSSTFVYKVLKHSLQYLLNSLKQSLRAYKRAQVREIHVDNWAERFRSKESLEFQTVHISNTPSEYLF